MDDKRAGDIANRILLVWMMDGEHGWQAAERLAADLTVAPLVPEESIDRLVNTGALSSFKVRRDPLRPTRRELDVLTLVAEGDSYQVVAEILGISHYTVKQHLKKIKARLNAKTTAEAVAIAVRTGLI